MTPPPMTNPPVSASRSSRGRLWSVRWLDALSMLCVVGALGVLLLPTLPTSHPIAPAIAVPAAARVSLPSDSASAQIVARNLFSATRRAPSVRFVPPGSETDAPPTPSPTSAAVADDGPRLYGIISQDGARRALLQLPGADSAPQLVSEGDRHAGYRIVSIGQDRVVVASSAGMRTVRLAPRAPSDSSEKLL